jgi:hypothetical protein
MDWFSETESKNPEHRYLHSKRIILNDLNQQSIQSDRATHTQPDHHPVLSMLSVIAEDSARLRQNQLTQNNLIALICNTSHAKRLVIAKELPVR